MVYGDVPGKLNFGDIPGSWHYYNNPGRLDYIVAVTRIVGLCGNFPDSLFAAATWKLLLRRGSGEYVFLWYDFPEAFDCSGDPGICFFLSGFSSAFLRSVLSPSQLIRLAPPSSPEYLLPPSLLFQQQLQPPTPPSCRRSPPGCL